MQEIPGEEASLENWAPLGPLVKLVPVASRELRVLRDQWAPQD